MKISVDRLTICGGVYGDLEEYLSNSLFVETSFFAKYPYRKSIKFLDGSILQIGEIDAVRSGKIKPLRYDFNPNNTTYEKEQMKIVQLMKNVHLTRLDVAFDVRDVDMSRWLWVDRLSRPYNVYYSGNGLVETWYVGGKDSEMRIRIYNKAKEQKMKDGTVWWRVEVQMRGKVSDCFSKYDLEYNPFEDVTPVINGNYQELDIKQRAMVNYLIDNPSGFDELSSKTRSEYKKLIRLIGSWECIDFYRVWKEKNSLVRSEVRSWLGLATEL